MPLEQPKVARVREETRKVDRSGLIRIDGLSYRVPDYLVKSSSHRRPIDCGIP